MKTFGDILRLALCVIVLALALSVPTSSQAGPATTAAATFNTNTFVIPANDGLWHTVLSTTIKNPTADDDLFIDVSQVTKITTTNTTSSATPAVISSGDAKLMMRVLVDGVEAKPGAIVFDEQLTTLTSELQTFLSLNCAQTPTPQTIVTTSCVCNPIAPGPPVISCDPVLPPPAGYTRTCTSQTTTDTDVVTTCTLVPGANQTLSTVLGLTLGHSFDFLAPEIGGMGHTHTVQVQEMLTQTTAQGGTAQAVIGPGTLKITAVNLK